MTRRNRTYRMVLALLFFLDLGYVIFYHASGQPDVIHKTFYYPVHFFIYTFAAIPLLYLLGAVLALLLAQRIPDRARKWLCGAGGLLLAAYAVLVALSYLFPDTVWSRLAYSPVMFVIKQPGVFVLPGILLALGLIRRQPA